MADRVIEEMRREEPDQPEMWVEVKLRVHDLQHRPECLPLPDKRLYLHHKLSAVTSKGKKYRRRNRAVDVKTERFKL
ncbi:hypothetical protein M5689_009753 [Euphorbia peplus]|nr:hypothetical protein M5689_009753 [Euphorbia peplus]